MFRFSLFPDGKIGRIIFVRGDLDTGSGLHILNISAGEPAVSGEFGNIEIDRSICLVGIPFCQKCFD